MPWLLDRPPEPVVGLAEGETRWRAMTAMTWPPRSEPSAYPHTPAVPCARDAAAV